MTINQPQPGASDKPSEAMKGRIAVVLNLVLIGVAIALDPLPLTAFLVVLPSRRGVVKGAAFVFGWLVSLAAVVAITVAATGNKPPKWQEHVDAMSPWFALGLAPALQPWVLIGAGAATVVEAKLSSGESFLALVLYCVLASSSYLAMEIYAVSRPGQSQELLARLRTRIDTHTDQMIIPGSLIIGFWLIANSLYLIVSQTAST